MSVESRRSSNGVPVKIECDGAVEISTIYARAGDG